MREVIRCDLQPQKSFILFCVVHGPPPPTILWKSFTSMCALNAWLVDAVILVSYLGCGTKYLRTLLKKGPQVFVTDTHRRLREPPTGNHWCRESHLAWLLFSLHYRHWSLLLAVSPAHPPPLHTQTFMTQTHLWVFTLFFLAWNAQNKNETLCAPIFSSDLNTVMCCMTSTWSTSDCRHNHRPILQKRFFKIPIREHGELNSFPHATGVSRVYKATVLPGVRR